jgi:hypothetical protein
MLGLAGVDAAFLLGLGFGLGELRLDHGRVQSQDLLPLW